MSVLLKLFKWLLYLLLGLVALAVMAYLGLGLSVTLPGEKLTPAGIERNTSQYLSMRDQVEIAVDLWLPEDYQQGQKLPTLIRATRYGRAYNVGFAMRVLIAAGQLKGDPNYREDIRVLNQQGYAVVKVDARGSGASFGQRLQEWSADEIADYGEVAEWITQQPWSNGRIGAYGVSYDGNAAEVGAVPNHPAVIAVAPQYTYFDIFQNLVRPGGVYDQWFIQRWSDATERMDKRQFCRGGAFKCWWRNKIMDGIKPVDADDGRQKREQAYATRNNPTVRDNIKDIAFRDDHYGQVPQSLDAISPIGHTDAIAASGVAMNVWVGWYDSGTVDGAISRFKTLPNKQQLIIAPYTHGGKHDTDVYAPVDKPVEPDLDGQNRQLAAFFDPLLKEGKPASSVAHQIRYFVMGDNQWKTTTQWPPAGIANARWLLSQGGGLAPQSDAMQNRAEGVDEYKVDFTATTGKRSRWQTISGPDVVYEDRQQEDKKLLTYTSAPLERDLQITGSPQVHLQLSSTHSDGALHVYLEDVAADGKVTYLTEGILRLSDRKLSPAPYVVEGAYHSLLRADNQPMIPGEKEQVVVPLFNIAAVIKQGHSIRVAIAGADAYTFERIPKQGEPVLSIYHGAEPSFIDLPQQWRN